MHSLEAKIGTTKVEIADVIEVADSKHVCFDLVGFSSLLFGTFVNTPPHNLFALCDYHNSKFNSSLSSGKLVMSSVNENLTMLFSSFR